MQRAVVIAALRGRLRAPGAAAAAAAGAGARTSRRRRAPEPVDEMKVAGTLGSLSDDEIAGPFQRRWDDITHCYDDAQAKLPYLGGKLELKLRVGAAGEPKSVYVVVVDHRQLRRRSTASWRSRARCTSAKPHGGSEAEFTYPLEFRARRPVSAWEEARVPPSLASATKRDVHECRAKLRRRRCRRSWR